MSSKNLRFFGNILSNINSMPPSDAISWQETSFPFIYPIFPHDLRAPCAVTPCREYESPIIYRIYIHDSARFLKNPIKSAQSGQATLYYERVERPCTLFSDSPFRAIIQLASGQSSPSLRSFGQQWSSLTARTPLRSLSSRVETWNEKSSYIHLLRIYTAS